MSLNSSSVRIVAPYPDTRRFAVKPRETGLSLLELMDLRFPYKSREQWRERIVKGRLKVNGQAVDADQKLYAGDVITHFNPRVYEPSVPDRVRTLRETSDYLLVFKPAPMPVHPGGRYNKNSLSEILKEQGYEGLKFVHRLDAVTSGLLLFAKTTDFARVATSCFREGRVEKKYYALVAGSPADDEASIDLPIRRKSGFVFECGRTLKGAKEAQTHIKVLKRRGGEALVEMEPVTGRTHQLRLHLKAWGHPIVDDPIYGPQGRQDGSVLQRRGIKLLNAGLRMAELDIDYRLDPPYLWLEDSRTTHPFPPSK